MAQQGDTQAQEQLVQNNLGYIRKTANELYISVGLGNSELGIDHDDLIQEGSIGLLRAISLYDPGKKIKFLTYAGPAIRNAMMDLISAAFATFEQRMQSDKDGIPMERINLDDLLPGEDPNRPYKSKYARSKCRHSNCFNVNLGYDFITDMLVLEFTIDDRIIDVRRNDNPWLNRAAQSLAEALRLVASKKLDVEFTELVTGYRLRTGSEASYVDIYLYDSLSSGAGYAVSVADAIAELLTDMKELLSSCNCGSACSKCLKHYRNQYVHGMLDRFAALQLLKWGVDGINASPIKPETQIKMIMPLANILKQSGCEINSDGEIVATGRRNTKKVVVYPAMWVEPQATGTIYVSDAYIKYAKPYAVQKILDSVQ